VATEVRYEHASEEREALLAQAFNTLAHGHQPERDELEAEVLDLPPLTSQNDEECSGGETRTLNLAGPSSRTSTSILSNKCC
jgi:hypothetical protein